MIDLSKIQTDYDNERAAFYAICAKAYEKGVPLFITEEHFLEHLDYFKFRLGREAQPRGQKPQVFYKGESLRQYLKTRGFEERDYMRVLQRVQAGWDIKEAIHTPKGDRRPSHDLRRRNVAMVSKKNGQIVLHGGKQASIVRGGATAISWKRFVKQGAQGV